MGGGKKHFAFFYLNMKMSNGKTKVEKEYRTIQLCSAIISLNNPKRPCNALKQGILCG